MFPNILFPNCADRGEASGSINLISDKPKKSQDLWNDSCFYGWMMEKNKNKIEAKVWQEKEELRDMFALRVKILGGKMCGVDGENVSSTEFQ